jgi:hypothetical protein
MGLEHVQERQRHRYSGSRIGREETSCNMIFGMVNPLNPPHNPKFYMQKKLQKMIGRAVDRTPDFSHATEDGVSDELMRHEIGDY